MPSLLFVYGTLRVGFDGAMALWLRQAARYLGKGSAEGALYRVAHYPGFVPEPGRRVIGDLFDLPDPVAMLARLDAYEECSADFAAPHEYRRMLLSVSTANGPVEAWIYVYARDVSALTRVPGGDFRA